MNTGKENMKGIFYFSKSKRDVHFLKSHNEAKFHCEGMSERRDSEVMATS